MEKINYDFINFVVSYTFNKVLIHFHVSVDGVGRNDFDLIKITTGEIIFPLIELSTKNFSSLVACDMCFVIELL